jgi:predicted acetyltransferase
MSDFNVAVPADQAELEAFVPVHRRTYFMTPEQGLEWAGWVNREDVRIVRSGDRMGGGAQLISMGQWFGERSVRMVGISNVGVEPEARASGAGTTLMRSILEELHGDGVPISTLYPATNTVYRRCGYEVAGSYISYRLETNHIDLRERTTPLELTEDRSKVKESYDAYAQRTAGLLDRTEHMWERTFEPWKQEARQCYLIGAPDEPEGYIAYHRTTAPDTWIQDLQAEVVALTGTAVRRVLSFAADHRSFCKTLNWNGSPSDPLAFALSEPRIAVRRSWPWMLRIVDLPAALTQRGYPNGADAELHLGVSDDLIGSNNGPFILRVGGGKGEVEPGGRASLQIDIRGLAPLYTGYLSAHELRSTGYVNGSDEDLSTASAAFAGPSPWLADFF